MPTGRPSKKPTIDLGKVESLCLLGLTDEQLATALGICRDTLYQWKQEWPEFSDAINAGRIDSDGEVVKSLRTKALEGDTTAMIFWLKNRHPKYWRDKHDHAHTGADGGPIAHSVDVRFHNAGSD
jgi:hypothetical protein